MKERVEVGSEKMVILECKVTFHKHSLLVLVGVHKVDEGLVVAGE
ncbi:hypothetical protein MtrunA17_Chr1g0161191 [Medicago truncatula]|uniref:Uncharacterized protein n=1 Tax=Medicago truncatula TaxID=3880 RepID=A0A396JIF9_MEDTR|nr:hypothetical protein MtrunA17_Chr1g0161191 [Medicago truncatula]